MVNGHKRYWNPISQWRLFVNIQSIISLYYAMTSLLVLVLESIVWHFKMHLVIDLPLCILLFAFEACSVNAEWNNYEQLSQTQQQNNEALVMMMILLLYIYTCTYIFYKLFFVVAAFRFVKANHVSQLCWNVHAILLVCHYTLISQNDYSTSAASAAAI